MAQSGVQASRDNVALPPLSKRKERWLAVLTVVVTLAVCFGLAEVVLRFLPVASGLRAVAVTAESPVFHFTPNRDFTFSRDWDLALVNRGHVNNAGFVNNQDYRMDDVRPLIAVVGDSYIEAEMVPFDESLHGRLAKRLAGKARVYSFAASGAPLSQYLIWARYAVSEYGASAVIINVVGNDFDESLAAYKTGPGFWHYVAEADNALRLRLFEYRPSMLRRIVVSSALGRYLALNLQVGALSTRLTTLLLGGPAMAEPRYAGNTATDAAPKRLADSLAAIDAFFRDLPVLVGLRPAQVAFTLDGFRYPNAAAAAAGSYFDLMRRAFRAKGEALGYEVLDLDPLFFVRHQRTGERFEYERDGHWNPQGHEVSLEAVMSSRLLTQFTR